MSAIKLELVNVDKDSGTFRKSGAYAIIRREMVAGVESLSRQRWDHAQDCIVYESIEGVCEVTTESGCGWKVLGEASQIAERCGL